MRGESMVTREGEGIFELGETEDSTRVPLIGYPGWNFVLQCVFESFACRELGDVFRLDLERLARSGIATRTCGAFGNAECAKTDQCYGFATAQGIFDAVKR